MTTEIIRSVDDMKTVAEIALRSGMMSVTNQSQAVMKILAGREMGLQPFAALNQIHIIKNKAVMGANMQAALIKMSPKYDYEIREFTEESISIEFFEMKNGGWKKVGTSSYDLAKAKKAGLLDKENKDGSDNNWQKYPENMLFARAISNGVKWYCPDLYNGAAVYAPDELGMQVQDGDGDSPIVVESVKPNELKGLTVQDLMDEYGAEAVMKANDMKVPPEDPAYLEELRNKIEETFGAV